MSAVGSPERASPFPAGCPVGGAVMAAPVAKAAPAPKYSRADFDRENLAFRTVYEGKELTFPILDRYFEWGMYDAADRTIVQCHCNRYHVLDLARAGAIKATHLAIMVLNRFLCDPKNPIERNVAQVYQRVMALVAKPREKIDMETREELRRRVINVAPNFYNRQIILIAKHLIETRQATDLKDALQKMTHEVCGNFVDAIACEMCRLDDAQANQ